MSQPDIIESSSLSLSSSTAAAAKISKRKQRATQFRQAVKKGESFSNKPAKSLSQAEYGELRAKKEATKQAKLAEREKRAKQIDEVKKTNKQEEEEAKTAAGKKTKRKLVDVDAQAENPNEDDGGDVQKKRQRTEKGEKHQGPRFILFIGNLPYSSTQAALQTHLVASKPDVIRIPTDKTTKKAKGFAFAEFMGQDASKRMKVCLRLHHTEFEGRKINVELTAGGGGQSTSRKQKLKEKNEKLEAERREFQEAKAVKDKAKITANTNTTSSGEQTHTAFVHPSRLARVQ
ncbi:hypothetical protein V1525DRAFT_393782 [Lipomyces kononenkoae]|uniref:Uncharacterized protein n=1 Tax=Lipomyces kononenkoae TaxID=34357 RepID=A0ACC3TB08_LIPKO